MGSADRAAGPHDPLLADRVALDGPGPGQVEPSILARLGLAVADVCDVVEQLAAADELITELVAENLVLRERLAQGGLSQ